MEVLQPRKQTRGPAMARRTPDSCCAIRTAAACLFFWLLFRPLGASTTSIAGAAVVIDAASASNALSLYSITTDALWQRDWRVRAWMRLSLSNAVRHCCAFAHARLAHHPIAGPPAGQSPRAAAGATGRERACVGTRRVETARARRGGPPTAASQRRDGRHGARRHVRVRLE